MGLHTDITGKQAVQTENCQDRKGCTKYKCMGGLFKRMLEINVLNTNMVSCTLIDH